MKRIIVIFLCVVTPALGMTQPGFIKVYDDSIPDKTLFRDMVVDKDTVVLYSVAWDGEGRQGMRFYKMDSLGNILSMKSYIDTSEWLVYSSGRKKIIATSDGGYAITGGIFSSLGPPYLLKVHHNLELDILKKYPSGNMSGGNSLVQMPDGGYMVLCWNVDNANNTKYSMVIRTDAEGEELWRKTYPVMDIRVLTVDLKKIDSNTFWVLAARSEILNFPNQVTWSNAYIFAIDSLGELKWDWEAKASDNIAWAWDCDLLDDGGMFCIGGTWEELSNSPGSYRSRPQIFRLDSDKNVVWQHIYSELYGASQYYRQMVKLPDNNYLVTGEMFPSFTPDGLPTAAMRGVHLKISPEGDSIWLRQDSVYENNTTKKVVIRGTGLLSSGSIVSMGTINTNTGPYGFLIKLSPNGCVDTLHCWPVANEPEIPGRRQALSVYPNPANDYVILSNNGVPFRKRSSIQLIDGLGRTVARIFPQGEADIRIDVANRPAGVYFYRYLVDGMEESVGRIVVEE